jgi:oligopeptidase B
VTAGFRDAQVDYREAAKWVAKLRATKTNDSELLLSVDMDSGHLGASGRVRSLGGQALIDAWILSRAQ